MGTEPSLSAKDDYQRISEDTKKHLVAWAERHIHKKTEGNLSDSDYDDEGRYVWGKENEDWEFYYQEDKEAYEQGLSTVPEILNPDALPRIN